MSSHVTSISSAEDKHPLGSYIIMAILGYLFLYLATKHVLLKEQFYISYGSLFLLFLFNKVERFKRVPLRIFFMLLGAFITLRYICWRSFYSLIYTGPLDFAAMMTLYLAEIYAVSVHLLGLFSGIWPIERKPVPLEGHASPLPTVDIFIPTYTEPLDLVKVTVEACKQIDYPQEKVRIYVLNDGGTVARRNNPKISKIAWERHYDCKRLTRELGVHYLTRENNEMAKSGNLNHALNHADGELILILDCDHVPTRDILKNTVGSFLKDKKLFLAQTPHNFINPDPMEKSLNSFSNAPGENEMFYHGVQLGLDFWNASYFCGSAAVLRRKYLEEVGGICGDTIVEDAETSLLLHNKKYNSVFIDRKMVCGLSPESFEHFIIQRTRWAQGMTQIFILKNPLLSKGLTWYQRLGYFNSCFFWFFGFSRFIFYIAPLAFLLFDLKVYHASMMQVLAYAVPHIFASLIVMDFLHGKHRWPFFSELYESVQSLYLLPAVISAIRNPEAPTFKVTPKGIKEKRNRVSPLVTPFYILFVLTFIGIIVAVVKWFYYPLYRDAISITFTWCMFNFFMMMASMGTFWEKQQERGTFRSWAKGKANISIPALKKTVEGEIQDISLNGIGLMVHLSFPLKQTESVVVEARDSYGEKYQFEGMVSRNIPRGEANFVGIEFQDAKAVYPRLVRFAHGDSQRWMDIKQKTSKSMNPIKVLGYLIRMGVKGSTETIKSLHIEAYYKYKRKIFS